ncbi:MAG: SEL1-like repeat protein [Bacteroidota bacterium]|nr:SEL1-like repeat protein [Bacteroidota bacterium]
MLKSRLLFSILLVYVNALYSQNGSNDSLQKIITQNYKLAIQYKNGDGVTIDYNKAYQYFNNAANLGDPQSIYAIAYMRYKGLGCQQDYTLAANLFAKGARMGKDNSLYFYGLCWRNGYGLPKNEDSAQYYLKKSADLGYKQALLELAMKQSENSNDSAAQVLMDQIHNAAIPDKKILNTFNKVTPHIDSRELITGDYEGWLIQYDWSGTHMVITKKLEVSLNSDADNISGQWIEEGADTVKLKARLSGDSLLFDNTKYGRKDHYSPNTYINYAFQDAKLELIQKNDSVFLAGSVEMFSPQRGEPSKPLFVALSRKGLVNMDSVINQLKLSAYPNPSSKTLYAEFTLPKAYNVNVQLYTLSGLMIYNKLSGLLDAGTYSLPIPVENIAAGTYVLKIDCGKISQSIKIVHY